MRRPRVGISITGVALFAAMMAPVGAAEAPKQRLDQIERAIESEREKQQRLSREAEALARELGKLREQAVAKARALQDSEEKLSTLEQHLAQLDADVASKETAFAQSRAELVRLVAALTRLGRQPPEAALVLPGSTIDAIRTAQLLGAVTPEIKEQAAALTRELEALQQARSATAAQRKLVADAAAQLAAERTPLAELIGQRAKLQTETEAAQRSSAARLERLARDAHDVRELIERLEAEREARQREAREQAAREAAAREAAAREAAARAAASEREAAERAAQEAQAQRQAQAARTPPAAPSGPKGAARPFHEARGELIAPARGRIVLSFGQPGPAGQTHRGLTIETRPAAQIVAPYDGQIAFAGPFRAYGLILIIEHSEGYHTLLAGLGRIDTAVGQWVTAGEPVGAAGSPETGNPSIYIELRRNGQPIDPLPWLASRNEKVSG